MPILETNVHPEEGLRRAILCTYNSEVGLEKLHFVVVCHLTLLLWRVTGRSYQLGLSLP